MSYKLSIFPNPIDSSCELTLDNGYVSYGYSDIYEGRICQSFDIPDGSPNSNGCSLKITHPNKTLILQRGILFLHVPNFPYPWGPNQTAALATDDFYLQDSSSFPTNPPTRMEVLRVNMHFRGGLFFNSPTYGNMPWWPSALAWCDSATRKLAYAESHKVNDTHQILNIPNGKPLYDEFGSNFYNPARFPALDWTNGMTSLDSRFNDLVDEIIEAGFKVIITMDEVYPYSIQIIRFVMEALEERQLPWCLTLPGYDGVFYGWEPSNTLIPGWASLARAIRPNCILGILFNAGHIPLGNGPVDYELPNPAQPNKGLMSGFDCILGQFPTVPPDLNNLDECNKVWQVLGRMIKPYNRPPEQPADDDPNPPFYLVDSPRGERTFVAFETWNPYNWVRIDPNNQAQVNAALLQIQAERDYFIARGCKYVG